MQVGGAHLLLLPPSWRPEAVFGTYIPGLGLILSLLILVLTGLVMKNLFGVQIVAGLESLVRRIPVVGAIYSGAKTFSETVLTDKGRSFKQVVMVEFPRKGAYSIGFITAHDLEEGDGEQGRRHADHREAGDGEHRQHRETDREPEPAEQPPAYRTCREGHRQRRPC